MDCACGCGQEMPPWKPRPSRTRPLYLKGHNFNVKGRAPHNYSGGVSRDVNGRWRIACRDGSWVYYYRAVMEAELRRPLRPDEHIHHINGDCSDDRIENLQLIDNHSHQQIHAGQNYKALERTRFPIPPEWYLAILAGWIEFNGREPTIMEWEADKTLPSGRTYWRAFGSWPRALELARSSST